MQVAFGQGVESFYAAPLANVDTVWEIAVVLEFIVWEAYVGRTSLGLNVVEVAKIMVVVDFFDFDTLLPVGQNPTGAVSHQVAAPVDSQQIKFSIGYDRPGSWVPAILGRVVAGRRFLQEIGMIGPAVILRSDPVGKCL